MMKNWKDLYKIKNVPRWVFWFPAQILKAMSCALYRHKVIDPNNYIKTESGIVVVTWHNRLLFYPAIFPKRQRVKTCAMVSPSRDGQYLTDLLSFFQLRTLRGSSYRRGAAAQLEAIRAIENGINVVFTPDGPRGPKYRMDRGPIHLASVTGRHIIPIGINYSSYWQLKSWDAFQIPKPCAKITLILGDAIDVPPSLDAEGIAEYQRRVTDELMKITHDR
ncbi:MAG: lysophospholipid acyltransferase family protein [Victivallaceae bacterium]|nr:lysophospholipid acyltransferase family protein [Victivallaceae bacterium]